MSKTDVELVEDLRRRLQVMHGAVLGRMVESIPALHMARLAKNIEAAVEAIILEAAADVLDRVKEAGYARPAINDLRAQLITAARELKAHKFHRGYSGDPDDPSIHAEAAKEEAISDVGEALLRALEG